jgi:hypothetical protein
MSVCWSQATVCAAIRFAAGGPRAASAADPIAGLATEVIKTMKIANLKLAWALGAILVVGLAVGAVAAFCRLGAADSPRDRFRASFKSGATVEVVGVSTLPTGHDTWWKPDGSPLLVAPVDSIGSQFSAPDARAARLILLRVTGLNTEETFRWLPTRYIGYWGGQPSQNGKPASDLQYYEATFPSELAECEVRARVAADIWLTEAANDGAGGVSMVQNGHNFDFGKARRFAASSRSGTAMAVAHNIAGRDKRLVAVDRGGKTHTGVHSISPSGEGNCLLDAEFDLPPDRIREFQVQSRPFEEAVIAGIALKRRDGQSAPTTDRSKPQAPTPSADIQPLAQTPARGDVDSDGDGLSDFQEIHKYHSDPSKFSSAGDGVSDDDWQRRREFTYTIRSIVKVMPPVKLECLNDDYQDARVLSGNDRFIELEVVHYPLNNNADSIRGNRDWRQDASRMATYLAPGITTNWDASMQRDLVAALRADGIDPDRLEDKDLVSRAAAWLLAKSKFVNMFCTHYMYYPNSRAAIFPGLESKFESDKGDRGWTVQEQLDRELFGKSMFVRRTHGTCTSSAVFLTTALRALGIPTRMVLGIPLVDGNDSAQMEMVRSAIHHHRVRQTLLQGLSGTQGYANHTFNEVFVGGRWARLNYTKLGQNSLDANTMGLLTHVNTFNDLSEIPLAATWGKRYALGERDDVFRYGNPYRCVELSDHFGKFAKVDNPEIREHRMMTISRAYWADDRSAPDMIRRVRRPSGGRGDGPAQLFVHGEEWFDEEPWQQLKTFLQAAGKEFLFKADGQLDVRGKITTGSCTSPTENLHEIEVIIPRDEYAKMKPGIAYRLVPRNEVPGYEWKLKGEVTIARNP